MPPLSHVCVCHPQHSARRFGPPLSRAAPCKGEKPLPCASGNKPHPSADLKVKSRGGGSLALPGRLNELPEIYLFTPTGENSVYLGAELLQIWDTAGQERFRTITQSYYRSANGAILAYDISKRGSFLSIPRWIEDVRKYAGSNIVQLLIGNKSDLSDLREVQLEEAQSLAEHYDNIICAIETSAKDSSNVEEAFVKMATELMMRHGGPMFSEKNTDSIKLDSKDVVEGWGCGC
ncbi:ras-related protein Rab-43 [Athene cunicularia]|uniref:ras-related protein Rab-43 n=1 Tax=Athene cunicularia TaxID=194338 RepID=UPI000EF6D62F|nr:ras-related protein Rab-43 [Athene cunicularia]